MVIISFIWNQILLGPATNFMVALDRVLFGNYGLAIIVFTIILRLATLPLTMRQMQSSRKMTTLQPRIQELQKKYSDPKRRNEEMMKLYKEQGVNPAGCFVPMLIQFPIWIALYQVIRITLGTTPESLIDLSHRLYPWNFVQQAVPLASHFLWLNLGDPDQTYILPVLVFVTMWLQQKLTMTKATMVANAQTAQTNQMMLWFMPILFAYFSLNFPSGLAMYWVITNLIGIVMNFFVFEWKLSDWREVVPQSLSLGLPRPQPRGPAPRPNARQTPRNAGRAAAGGSEASPNGVAAISAPGQNGATGKASRRRAAAPPPSKSQPKAPPVIRPPQAPRARRASNPAPDGEAETRSSDG